MKLPKIRLSVDSAIMTTASITLATSLFFLFHDGTLLDSADQANMKPVGTFKVSNNDVRRRVDAGMTWSNIDAPDKVYEGDSVFTGDKSEAQIVLENGNILKVDPKSLVVVHTKGNKTEINLMYGSLQGKISGGEPIVINENGVQQVLGGAAGSEIHIVKTAQSKNVRVQVTKGQISMNGADVKQDEVIKIGETKVSSVEKATVTLISPADGETTWLPMGKSLDFKWRLSGGAAGKGSKLELSHDSHFEKPFASVKANIDHASVAQIPEGTFYWRVKPEEGEPSLPAMATAYADVPPMPVLPQDQQVYTLEAEQNETSKSIYFTWEDKGGSITYDLELAKDAQFTKVLKTDHSKEKTIRIPDLAAGDYFWRVTGVNAARTNPPHSRVMAFSIKAGTRTPNAPKLASTEINYTIPRKLLDHRPASKADAGRGVKPEGLVPFTWDQPENASTYEVEVALDQTFANSVRHSTGTQASFTPQEVRPGTLYMRVRASSSDGRVGQPSAAARLNVSVPAPQLQKLKPVTSVFSTPDDFQKGSHEFKIAWTPQSYASSYELQWGADEKFSKSKTFNVKEASRAIKVSKSQAYAARVRALGPDGQPISGFSEIEIANYKKDLVAPKVVAKPAIDSRDPASEKLGALIATLPIPRLQEPTAATALVSLEDAPTFVTFKWGSWKGATSYTIQISSDADFSKVVAEQRVRNNRFIFQRGLPEGKVFWRVRAHTSTGYSNWSDPYDINVIYQ